MKMLLTLSLFFTLQTVQANEAVLHLDELRENYSLDFQNMWSESMGKNPINKKYEIFGLLIQNAQGEYKIRNYTKGTSTSTVSTDYSYSVGETLVGQVHTHPQVYVTSYSQFDRETPPSAADIVSLYDRKGYGSLKVNFSSLVLTTAKIYALLIEDEAKANAHFEKMKEDAKKVNKSLREYSDDLYTRTNVGNDIFEIQKNSARKLTGNAEVSGIGFYQTQGSEKLVFEKLN
jgi:Domain of unknown function (DUF4329)